MDFLNNPNSHLNSGVRKILRANPISYVKLVKESPARTSLKQVIWPLSMQAFSNWYKLLLRNPKSRWWIILGTLVYLFSPLDISPDVLPILGQIDDVILLTLLFSGVYEIVGDYLRSLKGQPPGSGVNHPPVDQPNAYHNSTPDPAVIDVEAKTIE
ncbi:MAG: YkvA family protein [Microcoleaceae cyanobacterium]